MEIRELLDKFDYPGDDTHIIFGSALCALNDTNHELGRDKVLELLKIMDETVNPPER